MNYPTDYVTIQVHDTCKVRLNRRKYLNGNKLVIEFLQQYRNSAFSELYICGKQFEELKKFKESGSFHDRVNKVVKNGLIEPMFLIGIHEDSQVHVKIVSDTANKSYGVLLRQQLSYIDDSKTRQQCFSAIKLSSHEFDYFIDVIGEMYHTLAPELKDISSCCTL